MVEEILGVEAQVRVNRLLNGGGVPFSSRPDAGVTCNMGWGGVEVGLWWEGVGLWWDGVWLWWDEVGMRSWNPVDERRQWRRRWRRWRRRW